MTSHSNPSYQNRSPARAHANGRRLASLDRYHWTAPALGGATASIETEDLFAQMWAPGLLGRLQEPLSRYHE